MDKRRKREYKKTRTATKIKQMQQRNLLLSPIHNKLNLRTVVSIKKKKRRSVMVSKPQHIVRNGISKKQTTINNTLTLRLLLRMSSPHFPLHNVLLFQCNIIKKDREDRM